MTRLERRAAVSAVCQEAGILQTCLDLRMHANGSADPWHEAMVKEAVAYLRCCLETWEPGIKGGEAFDAAVENLILATLEEVSL